MQISQSDFNNWKQDEVTKAVMAAVQQRAADYVTTLLGLATDDLNQVNWAKGYIFACQELLDISFEEAGESDA